MELEISSAFYRVYLHDDLRVCPDEATPEGGGQDKPIRGAGKGMESGKSRRGSASCGRAARRARTGRRKMTGILGKFHVEHGIQGARVTAQSQQLTPRCSNEVEIDTAIQMLKDDLDACGREMKRL